MSDPIDPADEPARGVEPPFPWVLLVLAAAMVWGAVSADGGWLRWAAIAGAIFLGAAALYQARPTATLPPGTAEPGDPPSPS